MTEQKLKKIISRLDDEVKDPETEIGDKPEYIVLSVFWELDTYGAAKYKTFFLTRTHKGELNHKDVNKIQFSEGEEPLTPEECAKGTATSEKFVSIVGKMEEVGTLLFSIYNKTEAEKECPQLVLAYYNTKPNPRNLYTGDMRRFETELNEQIQDLKTKFEEKKENDFKNEVTNIAKTNPINPKKYATVIARPWDALIKRGQYCFSDDLRSGEETPISIFGDIQTFITIWVENSDRTNLSKRELLVANAGFSIFREAEKLNMPPVITVSSIYKAMPGYGERASETEQEIIHMILEKFRTTDISINATTEYQAREKRRKDRNEEKEAGTFSVTDRFFPTRKFDFDPKRGKKQTFWLFHATPPILQYAEEVGNKVIETPIEYLRICEVNEAGELQRHKRIKTSMDRMIILDYLNYRVNIMEYDLRKARDRFSNYKYSCKMRKKPIEKDIRDCMENPNYNLIKLVTLMQETEIYEASDTKLSRIRDFCIKVFTYWKAIGRIEGHELRYAKKANGSNGKRTIEAFEIKFRI